MTGGWRSLAGSYHVVEATTGVDRIAWQAAEEAGLVTCLVTGSKTKLGHMAGVDPRRQRPREPEHPLPLL